MPRLSQFWLLLEGTLVLAGCQAPVAHALPTEVPPGLRRREGESFAQVRAYYGIPILQKSLYWDGNGETDEFGPSCHVFHHITNTVAIGAGANLSTWLIPGADAYSAEVESVLRIYPDAASPLFLDFSGGYQQSTEPVPPGGTEWNYTFGFGPGFEFPMGRGSSLMIAANYHHVSNALGRENERNPSQNEARLWIGYAWNF